MSDYEPRYRLSQIALATGAPVNTIRAWFHRGHISYLETDQTATGAGLAHSLSMRSALRIGCIKRLVDLGISPASANIAALHWMDTGDVERAPGGLFSIHEKGETVLWVFPDGTPRVALMDEPLGMLRDGSGRPRDGGTFVNLNMIDQDVRSGLSKAGHA